MELKVTHDRTKRSIQLKVTNGPLFEPHDQNRYRRRHVQGRADTLVISATIETTTGTLVHPIKVDSVKLLGPQLKADKTVSPTLRVSASWSDNSYMQEKIEDMPAWLWKAVRDALTGSTECTVDLSTTDAVTA